MTSRQALVRFCVALTLTLGTTYIAWRWFFSINWTVWWIAIPLVIAETYSLTDSFLFGMTMWRKRERGEPPPSIPGATVDVLITTYNEPVEMVMTTAYAALAITHPHKTWILDDGARGDMADAAAAAGVGYLIRSDDWTGRQRHAKAGNLNNALMAIDGEFLLILDADQIPEPAILDRTLGYFRDEQVSLVQTPQWFSNVTDSDPLGSQSPLFYGPIQQGKDGWNAAFFCGSNAMLRREALMQLGVLGYVEEVQRTVEVGLRSAARALAKSGRSSYHSEPVDLALAGVRAAVQTATHGLAADEPLSAVTYQFQRQIDQASRDLVTSDLALLEADLAVIAELEGGFTGPLDGGSFAEGVLDRLSERDWSPLAAIESIQAVVRAVDVDRAEEAQAVMPMATISVTEDMATAMRMHSLGWKSVYHNEILAKGLAPDDLSTMLQQRLRWAQGTLQVMLRENPLTKLGLSLGQRLMYLSTMWTYLSGFAAIVYIAGPVLFLCFGVQPVKSYGGQFLLFFLPYLLANQLLFLVVGYGVKTWRGHQYSLALFPLWIRACVTAVGNVVFGRTLGFVVTSKVQGERTSQWRFIRPQLAAMAVLAGAAVIGIIRQLTGLEPSLWGTIVNVAWVIYDLVVLSVIVEAARFQGAPTPEEVSP